MKRQRGRGRKPGNNNNRSFESNGPDVKIRGNASTVYDKYLQLARDATSSGDRIMAENYYQHAEHYYRVVQAQQAQQQQRREDMNRNQQNRGDQNNSDDQDGSDKQGSDDNRRNRRPRNNDADNKSAGRDPSRDEQPDTSNEASNKPRRGRPRKSDSDKSDPLAVVNPEGDQPEVEKKPRRRRTSKPVDDAAQKALDKADSKSDEDTEAA